MTDTRTEQAMDAGVVALKAAGVDISIRDDQPPTWVFGGQTWIYVRGESTGGAFGMVEQLMAPGLATPLHIHHKEDEGVYVVEGTLRIVCGDERWEAGPGTWLKLPRGVPHAMQAVGNTPGRFLEMFLPAGLERLFEAIGQDSPTARPDIPSLLEAAAPFELELLGPMPT